METAENRPIENAMDKRKVAKPILERRTCSNPDCGKIWDDKNTTICLDCGWGTRLHEGK